MDILADLNPQQKLAVEHRTGPALVLAGAGSGKTRVITHRIAYLICNSVSRPENILAVTFTNKAAKEMRDRVHRIIGPMRSAEPLISTFHSFCVRFLRREIHHAGYRRDFSIYDTDDQKRLVKKILDELNDAELELTPREIINRISYAKNRGISPERYAHRFPSETAEEIEYIYGKYNARLRHSNSLDFDDLLLTSVVILKKQPELKKHYSHRYKYILVDEYQDTNRPQYELLRLLTAAHNNLFVVGDEDQSIYKFRGADIQNILKFEKDFPGARIIKLEQNYRSSQNILQVAGAVVGHNTERKGKVLWTQNAGGDVITCSCAESPREEAEWIVQRIRSLFEENPEHHIAILYRANFLSRNFEDVLLDAGIPYAVVGSVAFFGRMEVKDLLAYLRIIFNPEDDIALLRILNTPPRGIGKATMELLTQAALDKGIPIMQALREKTKDPQFPGRASRALRRFQELADKWTGLQDTHTAAGILETIVKDIQYREMLTKQETAAEAENRRNNIEELIRAAAESEQRGETISDFLDRAALSSELDRLDSSSRVALMTLHSAKGLEFEVVFMAGMEEGLFPHSQSMGTNEDLEEERRLCYVGITRAKEKLFVTWTPFRKSYGPDAGFPAKVSRFLEEMPQDLIEGLDSEIYESFDQRPRFGSRFYGQSQKDNWQSDADKNKVREEPFIQPKSIAELKDYLKQEQRKMDAGSGKSGTGSIIKAGMRVRHDKFGEGIVLSRQRMGNEIKLVVTFSRLGKKSLIEKYANLKPL
jgi:DNA helicase-2/ATP-dependent DNA helicase PcrA